MSDDTIYNPVHAHQPTPATIWIFLSYLQSWQQPRECFHSRKKLRLFHGIMVETYLSNCRDLLLLPFEKSFSYHRVY